MSNAKTATPAAKPIAYQRTANGLPRKLRGMLALSDFEHAAKAHLPRMLYGYISGAVETGAAFAASAAAYAGYALVPRTLVDVAGRSQARTLFGRTYPAPFGICPMGGASIAAYRGDIEIARAAAAEDIPNVLSASSLTKLEDIRPNGPTTWFQGYLPGNNERVEAMVDRAEQAGYDTFVLTVDVPVLGNRENNVRNGYSTPFVITPKLAFDCATHPNWLIGTLARTMLTTGMPHFENMDAERGAPLFSKNIVRNTIGRDRLSWAHVEVIRRKWAGKFVIKGILSSADAILAREHGADGVVVSSHGGRQLDHSIAPLAVLPEIKAASGEMAVMIDGGIRRGTDVLKALALGADFVFIGRPMMYAAVIGGESAVRHAISILKDEINRDMALLGVTTLNDITPDFLRRKG